MPDSSGLFDGKLIGEAKPMHWTKTKPTKPGWWWCRGVFGANAESIRVCKIWSDEGALWVFDPTKYVATTRIERRCEPWEEVEWSSSPIPEPKEE